MHALLSFVLEAVEPGTFIDFVRVKLRTASLLLQEIFAEAPSSEPVLAGHYQAG